MVSRVTDRVPRVLPWLVLALITLAHTVHSQSGWVSRNSGTGHDVNQVFFISITTGWAAVSDGQVLKSTNGGREWAPTPTGVTSNLRSLFFATASLGWAVGDNGVGIRTTDGGASWQPFNTGTSHNLRATTFASPLVGWIAGGELSTQTGSILKTTDGGDSWIPQFTVGTGEMLDIAHIDTNKAWAAASSGRLYATTNGGANWFMQFDWGPNQPNSIAAVYPDRLWLAGGQGLIYVSTNSGIDWAFQSFPASLPRTIYSIMFLDAQRGWTAGQSGKIYFTTDGGSTWSPQTSGSSSDLKCVSFLDDSTGWACGNGGVILSTTTGGIITGVEDEDRQSPKFYTLQQNFPNPFNPSTTIQVSLPLTSDLTIKIFDILGEEVAVLTSARYPPGVHQFTWTAADVPSGIYFCTMNAGGQVRTIRVALLR
jgi:photosystem II stability/assembly factor-like uncharacterized protein